MMKKKNGVKDEMKECKKIRKEKYKRKKIKQQKKEYWREEK